jgi:hypothetical protein
MSPAEEALEALVTRWRTYESDSVNADRAFGIELGYSWAADELKALLFRTNN